MEIAKRYYYSYVGTSAETKPASEVEPGNEFYETDTGRTYIYDGSAWVLNQDLVQVSGSNTEQIPGEAIPSKAIMIGTSDGSKLRALEVFSCLNGRKPLRVALTDTNVGVGINSTAMSADGYGNDNGINTGAYLMALTGTTWDRLRYGKTFKYVNVSSSGDNDVWTPSSGKKFRLLGGLIQCGTAATDIFLKDGSTQISPTFKMGAYQILSLDGLFARSNGLVSSTANNVLKINLSAANPVAVWVCGTEE